MTQAQDDLAIPAFLDRARGATRADIDGLRARLNADSGPPAPRSWASFSAAARQPSAADEQAIRDLRDEQAQARKVRAENRIARLTVRRPPPPGSTWDQRRGRWVLDPTAPAAQPRPAVTRTKSGILIGSL